METLKLKPLKEKWQSTLSQLSWLSALLPYSRCKSLVKKRTLKLNSAVRGYLVSLTALRNTLNLNGFLYYGLIICVVVSPLANEFYHVFDPTQRIEGWYFLNYYYYFFSIGEQLSKVFFIVGLYIIAYPKLDKKLLNTIFILSTTYPIAKIMWQSASQTDEQYHSAIPVYIIIVTIGLIISVLLTFDYFMNRKYHKYDGYWARLLGLARIKADHELIESEIKKLQSFNSKY